MASRTIPRPQILATPGAPEALARVVAVLARARNRAARLPPLAEPRPRARAT